MSPSEPYVLRLEERNKNAIGPAVLARLEAGLDEAAGAPLLLAGTPDAFCAGLDLLHVADADERALRSFLLDVDRVVGRLATYPGATVAAVDGHAIAGGAVLARACDHAVARDDAKIRIGINEVALGVCFPPIILRLMATRLPRQTVRRAMLGADLHDPRTALALGLVDELANDAEAVARERLEAFAKRPARAVALTKRALARSLEIDDEDRARFEEELREWSSDEVRSRVKAILGR